MKPCRTLFYLLALSLLSQHVRAQAPNDPEEIFMKACERVYEAKNYRFSGKFFASAKIDFAAISKGKTPPKIKGAYKKMQKELGRSFEINGEIKGAQEDNNSRFEIANLSMLGTGKRKQAVPIKQHIVVIYNGEKLYQTYIGSHMDVNAEVQQGFTLLPDPNNDYTFTYRLYPAIKINGVEGYPIEVFGWDEDKNTHRIFTIDPKTHRLLRAEIKVNNGTIQMTVTKEEFDVALQPNTFQPVSPGKITSSVNKNTSKSGVPFQFDFIPSTTTKSK